MSTNNYDSMSHAELRDYVRYHPEDESAFHALMDRLDRLPKTLVTTDEEIRSELIKRIEQKNEQQQ